MPQFFEFFQVFFPGNFNIIESFAIIQEVFPESGIAVQEVDGQTVAHKFIGFCPPGELVRIKFENGPDDGNSGKKRFELVAIGDMELDPSAYLPAPFVKHGFEVVGTEKDAGKSFFFQ